MSLLAESYQEESILSCKTKKQFCSICNKAFSTSGNLKSHILTIHNDCYPFNCTYPNCTKRYSNRSRLETHLRTHKGVKPYECLYCQKKFNENGNLKTHLRLHSHERPFTCDICLKTYKTNGHLKDHKNIRHFKIKKFECDQCCKSFGRSSTLKAHRRIHTGEKPFQCLEPSCMKSFTEKGNMLIHYKRHLKSSQSALSEKFSISSEDCTQFQSSSGNDYNFSSVNGHSAKDFSNLVIEAPISINILKQPSFEPLFLQEKEMNGKNSFEEKKNSVSIQESNYFLFGDMEEVDEADEYIFEVN